MDTSNRGWRQVEWTQTCTHGNESRLCSQHELITTSPFWLPRVMKCCQPQFFQASLPCIIHPSVQNNLSVSGDSGVCLCLSASPWMCINELQPNWQPVLAQYTRVRWHSHLTLYYILPVQDLIAATQCYMCTSVVITHRMCNIMFREYVHLISHQIRDKDTTLISRRSKPQARTVVLDSALNLTRIFLCLIHMKQGVPLFFFLLQIVCRWNVGYTVYDLWLNVLF